MKILLTVGTTKFDSLVRYVDLNFDLSQFKLTLQIANGEYIPTRFEYFTYTDQIENYYQAADLIITHAGAGTIFRLLELNKKMIVIPNLDRIDSHQIDIAEYMHKKGHARMILDFDDLKEAVSKVVQSKFLPFRKQDFFAANEIIDFCLK